MYIDKIIDRKKLIKKLQGMYFNTIKIIVDNESNYIKLVDNDGTVEFKVIQ